MQGSLEKANKSDSLITTLAIRKPTGEVKKSNKKVLDEEEYIEVIIKTNRWECNLLCCGRLM